MHFPISFVYKHPPLCEGRMCPSGYAEILCLENREEIDAFPPGPVLESVFYFPTFLFFQTKQLVFCSNLHSKVRPIKMLIPGLSHNFYGTGAVKSPDKNLSSQSKSVVPCRKEEIAK